MKPILERNIDAVIERLRPLHDFVLVQRIIEDKPAPDSLLVLPDAAKRPVMGLRRGVAVRVGRGDMTPDGGRLPIHVEPGDEVIYTRCPDNDVRINGGEYTFLHEEQHIFAVVER